MIEFYDATMVMQRDLGTLLTCSLRYAMGRRSVVVCDVATLVRKFADELSDEDLYVVHRDLNCELMSVESNQRTLGFESDHEIWTELRGYLSRLLAERENKKAASK